MSASRVRLDMTALDVVVALAEGNPGALSVCCSALKEAAAIDPDAFLGGLGVLLSFDERRIYGPRIWMLYKDVCGHDLVATLACLRAVQLGLLKDDALQQAIDNGGHGIEAKKVLSDVRGRLPRFGSDQPEVAAPMGRPERAP